MDDITKPSELKTTRSVLWPAEDSPSSAFQCTELAGQPWQLVFLLIVTFAQNVIYIPSVQMVPLNCKELLSFSFWETHFLGIPPKNSAGYPPHPFVTFLQLTSAKLKLEATNLINVLCIAQKSNYMSHHLPHWISINKNLGEKAGSWTQSSMWDIGLSILTRSNTCPWIWLMLGSCWSSTEAGT